jgi:putative transposase
VKLDKKPIEVVREWPHTIRTIEDERILDILLSEPAGTRRVNKDNGINLDGGSYIHPELAAHIGEDMQLYYDDRDIGSVYVYDCFGKFVCIAKDPSITGVSRKEVATKAKRIQKEAIQEERRRLKAAAKKVTKVDVAQQILQHRAEVVAKGNVAEFPKPTESHSSEGTTQAGRALQQPEVDKTLIAKAKAALQQDQEEKAEPKTAQIVSLGNDAQKYALWQDLNARVQAGESIDNERMQRFYKNFPSSSAYKVQLQMVEMRKEFEQRTSKSFA